LEKFVPVFSLPPADGVLAHKSRKWVQQLKSFGGEVKNSYQNLQSGFGYFTTPSFATSRTSRWYVSRLYLGGTLSLLEIGGDQIATRYFLESDGHRGYFSFLEFKKKLMSFSGRFDCILPT
jgi:hypothetical protein